MGARVGLIGFGLAGRVFHAPLIAAEPMLVLAAVASSRTEEVRAAHPGAATFADPAALIADQTLDLVVIASPNATHAPIAAAALAAGRHVVVDKPFAAGPADAAALIDASRIAGRMLTVFQNRRWDGDFLTAARLMRERRLGEIMLAELYWDRFRPVPRSGWREQAGAEAGLLADLGPHLGDQALRLFGTPEAVTGDVAAQRAGAAVDDWFSATLHYGRSRVRIGAASLVAASRPRFALHGTAGSFVKHGIDPQEAVLRAGGAPDDAGYGVEPPAAWGTLTDADGSTCPIETERGDWRHFYAGVAATVLDGAPPPVPAEEAMDVVRLVECIRRSATEARTLPFG